jgi:hypothetical protein
MHDMMPMQSIQGQSNQSQSDQRGMSGMQSQGGMRGGMSGGMQQQGMEVDEHEREMMLMRGMLPGMSMGPAQVDLTDRIEGRIAFLRAELEIADAQTAAWNSFADSLRSARQHLVEARKALTQTSPSSRLEQYEKHLTERLQGLKDVRAAYQTLLAVLNDHQKHTAEQLIVPYIATF